MKRGGRVVRALDSQPVGAGFDPTPLHVMTLSKSCIHDYLGLLCLHPFEVDKSRTSLGRGWGYDDNVRGRLDIHSKSVGKQLYE